MIARPASAGHAGSSERWPDTALVCIVGVALCCVLLWVTGGIVVFVSSGRWIDVGLSDMGGVAVRLLTEPSDPAAAWPRRIARDVPGPLAFYGVFSGVLTTAAVLGVAAYRRLATGREPSSSAWATTRDLRPLIVKDVPSGRLALGRVGRALVAAEERQSVIVLGPTQSMKTSGFAIPSILEWRGPVIATSVKTDLVKDTIGARGTMGATWLFDPSGCTAMETARWSPLQQCGDWRGAQRVASWLAGSAVRGESGIEQADFWYTSAAKLLAPLFYAAATSGRSIRDVVRWVNTQE